MPFLEGLNRGRKMTRYCIACVFACALAGCTLEQLQQTGEAVQNTAQATKAGADVVAANVPAVSEDAAKVAHEAGKVAKVAGEVKNALSLEDEQARNQAIANAAAPFAGPYAPLVQAFGGVFLTLVGGWLGNIFGKKKGIKAIHSVDAVIHDPAHADITLGELAKGNTAANVALASKDRESGVKKFVAEALSQ